MADESPNRVVQAPHPPDPGGVSSTFPSAVTQTSTLGREVASIAQATSAAQPVSNVPSPSISSTTVAGGDVADPLDYFDEVFGPPQTRWPVPTNDVFQDFDDEDRKYRSKLLKFLASKVSDQTKCCGYFSNIKRKHKLLRYHSNSNDKLGIFANTISDCLACSENDILKLKLLANKSEEERLAFLNRKEMNKSVSYPFLDYIMAKTFNNPKVSDIQNIVASWDDELTETVNFYNSVIISSDEMRWLYNKVAKKTAECRNDKYIAQLYRLLVLIEKRKQTVNPFVFVCAPSGSGKTALAYNLARHKCPMIYCVKSSEWGDDTQSPYLPFKEISMQLDTALKADLDSFMGPNRSDKKAFKASRVELTKKININRPFQTVHFFVELFKRLLEVQKTNEKSWMEAQLSLDLVLSGELSIEAGINEIANLMNSRGLNSFEPFIVFIDEYIFNRSNRGVVIGESAAEMVFLRNILRILRVIPFMAGTDAKSSNFCSRQSDSSGFDPTSAIWAVILNDLAQFNPSILSNLPPNLTDHPKAKAIVDFLMQVSVNENPWLIQLSLDFIIGLNKSVWNTFSLEDILNDMCNYLYNSFLSRKSEHLTFTKSQIAYTKGRLWNGNVLQVPVFDDDCINRHLGRLRLIPYKDGTPFSMLMIESIGNSSTEVYITPERKPDDTRSRFFIPKSVFSSFTNTPLTGLCLFGLNISKRPPYMQPKIVRKSAGIVLEPPYQQYQLKEIESYPRISSMDAVLTHNWHWLTMRSGTFLEIVCNSAVIMASRANGPGGCPFPKFMQFFIQELTTVRQSLPPNSKITRNFPRHLPIVTFGENNCSVGCFESKIIPLLAPMAVTKWSSAAVDLMRKTVDGGKCRLGTFMFSTSNDKVDHLIMEFNYGDSQSEFISSQSHSIPTVGNKMYNHFDYESTFEPSLIKGIPLACECKSLNKDLSISGVKGIVLNKFKNLHQVDLANKLLKENDDGPMSCRTFIILAINTSEWTSLTSSTIESLLEINTAKYYLWHLTRTSSGDDTRPFHYAVLPVFESFQVKRQDDFKDVVIVPLSEIIGAGFSEDLFRYVMEGAAVIEEENERLRLIEEAANEASGSEDVVERDSKKTKLDPQTSKDETFYIDFDLSDDDKGKEKMPI